MHHELLSFKTIDDVLQENAGNVILVESLRSQLASKQTALNNKQTTLNEINNKLIKLEGELDIKTTQLESKEDLLVSKEEFITSLQDAKSRIATEIESQSITITKLAQQIISCGNNPGN